MTPKLYILSFITLLFLLLLPFIALADWKQEWERIVQAVKKDRWFSGKHRYIDPEGKYILAYIGNSSGSGQLSYHVQQADPKEFQSFWDLTQPKWKGKIVSLEPANTGLGSSMQFYYYNPELGPEWIKRFFGSMEITFRREFRQMMAAAQLWLADVQPL